MYEQAQSRLERDQMKKDIPITEYAASLGFTLVRRGRFFSTKEHDSIMIDPVGNTYRQFSKSPRKKSVIDFSMEFENKSRKKATRDLMKMWKQRQGIAVPLPVPDKVSKPKQPQEKKPFCLPERDRNHRQVYAYLTKTRGIEKEIVRDFLHKKLLYQEKEHKNCVFVGYGREGEPIFASMRSTLTDKKFVCDVEGCDYQQGIYMENGQNTLLVTESAIDCMSVMSLLILHENNPDKSNYLILNGAKKLAPLFYHIQNKPQINRVILALDNDHAGQEGAQLARTMLRSMDFRGEILDALPQTTKDWNDELQHWKQYRKIEKIPIRFLDFEP